VGAIIRRGEGVAIWFDIAKGQRLSKMLADREMAPDMSPLPTFMNISRFVVPAVLGLMGLSLTARDTHADSIGVHFSADGSPAFTLAAGTSAGVVPQTNFNNITGSLGTGVALRNNNGAATNATLTFGAGGINAFFATSVGGDETLNNSSVFSAAGNPSNFTLNNISYDRYDIYVYTLSFGGANQQTTLGTTSFYGTSPVPNAPGYVDNNTATPYTYTQATSQVSYTPGANYVRFSGLTGSTQSFSVTGLGGAGSVGGFQIVQTVPTPEPSTYAMMALGLVALCVLGAKRRKNEQAI
jgi:hypothetical protein